MPLSRNLLDRVQPEPSSIRRITEPVGDVVTLAQQRLYMRVDETKDDSEIQAMLDSAVRTAEDFMERSLIDQKWRITYDAVPFDFLSIPDLPRILELSRPPIKTLDLVEFTKLDGTTDTVTLTDLINDFQAEPGRIALKPGANWPTGLQSINAIRFEYSTGYGTAGSNTIPPGIKQAIRRIVSTWYEQREDMVTGTIAIKMPDGIFTLATQILYPWKVIDL